MGFFFHSLSGDATIMIVRNCPIIGEHVVIVFVTQKFIIATVWPAKNTLRFSFKFLYLTKRHIEILYLLSNFDKQNKIQILTTFKKIMYMGFGATLQSTLAMINGAKWSLQPLT